MKFVDGYIVVHTNKNGLNKKKEMVFARKQDMMNYNETKKLLILYIAYWIFTLIFYALGPFSWITYKPIAFWGLNLLYIISFIIGVMLPKCTKQENKWGGMDEKWMLKRLSICSYVNLGYEVIALFRSYLMERFDVVELLKKLLFGINNMGIAYSQAYENVGATSDNILGGKYITLFNYFWEFFSFTVLLLCFIFFKELKREAKVCFGATLMVITVSYLAKGTNIGVFRLIFAVIIFLYLYNLKKNVISKRTILALAIVAIVVVLFYFNKTMEARGGILSWQSANYNIGGIGIDNDSIFFMFVPVGLYRLLVALAGYLTQGYYGMSLSLRVGWMPTFGVGNSMFLLGILNRVGINIERITYQARIEEFGWENKVRWHTMYSWLANDISYIGVIFFMLLYGYLFHSALIDATTNNNPYAKVMVYYFSLMAIFLPCNNQIAQSSYVLFSFIYCFLRWRLSIRGIKIKIGKSIYL